MEKTTSYSAFLDEYNEIILLVKRPIIERPTEPFYLEDLMTGEIIECHVAEVVELEQYVKYRLIICQFLKLLHAFDVVDHGKNRTPLQIGSITRSKFFDERYFDGNAQLGFIYSEGKTQFKIWAPTAVKAELVLYFPDGRIEATDMVRNATGIWSTTICQNLDSINYRYRISHRFHCCEITDPYGIASTANGTYSTVIDLKKTIPVRTFSHPLIENVTDAIIYEISVRDFTMHADIAPHLQGTYLGFIKKLDYLKSLGVTHIQLLPIFDFEGVDELDPKKMYNWGYNPSQFNVPEGSYATDPANPYTRINELKTLINAIHDAGFGVVMDVVYNHVYKRSTHPFEFLVPTYFYRYDLNGRPTDGSGCGNDLATERNMVRKYILDSIKYWLYEYGLDGFRIDLMGLLDVQTMNEVRKICDAAGKSVLLYGEGWNLNTGLAEHKRATMKNAHLLPRIGHFNDFFRDILKGSTFNHLEKGLVLGNLSLLESAKEALGGSCGRAMGQAGKFFNPAQSINYVEAHDNHTFWDRAKISNGQEADNHLKLRQQMATAMVILSEGVPFIHGGQEFFRTKKGVENSYQSPDHINIFDWQLLKENEKYVNLTRGYIQIRQAHGAFRFASSYLVKKHVTISDINRQLLLFELNDVAAFGPWSAIKVIYNLSLDAAQLTQDLTGWKLIANETVSGIIPLATLKKGEKLKIPPLSTSILILD